MTVFSVRPRLAGKLMHSLRNGYEKSPYGVRVMAGKALRHLPVALRYGPVYRQTRALLQESDYWDRGRWLEAQTAGLHKVIDHAYHCTAYYRRMMDRLGITPADIRDLADLQYLPLLTREDVRNHVEELLANDIRESSMKYATTGGTSGKPLGFYIDKDSSVVDWSFMVFQWERIGYQEGDLRLVLRGRTVADQGGERVWEYNPIHNELIFSSFHLSEEYLPCLVGLIRSRKPAFLHAYPSTAMILAQYILERGLRGLPKFKALLLGSENILQAQRSFLQEAFDCRVYTWYGHSEKCILAGECEFSQQYHVFPQYGIVEIVDADGRPITEPGVAGQLVGTSLISFGMPFIRYLTDDWAQWASSDVCECDRSYPRIENVIGRWDQEVLIGQSGAFFPISALNLHSRIYTKIRQFQFYQDLPGEVILLIVPERDCTAEDQQQILQEFAQKIGHDFKLSIEPVSSIPQTARGKYKFVDQRLPVDMSTFQGGA